MMLLCLTAQYLHYKSEEDVNRVIHYGLLGALLMCGTGCATGNAGGEPEALESYNRAVFNFNYQFDKYVLKPVAEGYRAVTPQAVRNRVSSIIANLKEPISAGNLLLQGEPVDSMASVGRFALNSTLGLAGMFDVAEGFGLPQKKTDFNETLAKWCVPSGPFIVLPFLGPSSPRALTGMVVDYAFDPVFWATYNDANVRAKVNYSYAAIKAVSMREAALDLLDDLERNSVDFYATMRSAYIQNQSKLRCWKDADSNETTYDFDFGIEDEDEIFDEMEAE